MHDQLARFIRGGYIELSLDDNLTIKNCSSKLLELLGYTKKEFKTYVKMSFYNIIAEEDRIYIENNFKKECKKKEPQLYFKLLCKDSSHMPGIDLINCSYNKLRRKLTVQNLLIDPSHLKHLELEKDIEAERYRVVAEQSDSIIFDYNIDDGTIFLNSNYEKKFGFPYFYGNFNELVFKEKLILEDDFKKIKALSIENKDYNEIEIRIKKFDGTYIWCKVRMSTIFNRNNKPVRLIGKIIDVDNSRREKQQLIEKTKRDIMTGLFNKHATETLISEELLGNPSSLGALILFDIDNFKQINDIFGHIEGDKVLSRISEEIKKTFRASDIIGRIGGDEFIVYLKDLPAEAHAILKAQDILNIIKNLFSLSENGFSVSVSMGISFFNKDGDLYHTLFKKADIALYASKRRGKNTYTVYDAFMEKRSLI